MSSPPPVLAAALTEKSKPNKKHKDKGKLKEKASGQVIESKLRNEGVDPNWAYRPPDGMVVVDTSKVDDDFDFDLLKNDANKELWIVRIPDGFKTKLLDGLEIQQPSKAPGAKISTLEGKRAKYDIWSVEHFSNTEELIEDNERPPRGEEVRTLSCLLPRKKKQGNLFLAPKITSQHIIIAHSPAIPNVDDAATPTPSTRHSVPKHLLKHRFLPFGASSSSDRIRHPASAMDVDLLNETGSQRVADHKAELLPLGEHERTPQKKSGQSPETAGKKRKNAGGESETPKHRSKKLKL